MNGSLGWVEPHRTVWLQQNFAGSEGEEEEEAFWILYPFALPPHTFNRLQMFGQKPGNTLPFWVSFPAGPTLTIDTLGASVLSFLTRTPETGQVRGCRPPPGLPVQLSPCRPPFEPLSGLPSPLCPRPRRPPPRRQRRPPPPPRLPAPAPAPTRRGCAGGSSTPSATPAGGGCWQKAGP